MPAHLTDLTGSSRCIKRLAVRTVMFCIGRSCCGSQWSVVRPSADLYSRPDLSLTHADTGTRAGCGLDEHTAPPLASLAELLPPSTRRAPKVESVAATIVAMFERM